MIYIIRHGQTDQNLAYRIQGQRDFPLNETGKAQALDAAKNLQARGISFSQVISSPLTRALETARIVADGVPIETDDRLKEMDYGPYEGADLKNLPEEMLYFFKDFNNHPAPDGVEQLPDLVARLGEFLEDLKSRLALNSDGDLLLSTHAIAMKACLEYLTPESHGNYWSKYVANCAVYCFEFKDGRFTVPEELVL